MLRALSVSIVILAGAVWLVPPVHEVAAELAIRAADRFDKRPERAILLIGNSRTYYHGLPAMVRRMADSAHSAERYAISTRALAGGSLEDSWNDAETQHLLGRDWRDVVIQAESRAQSSDENRARFFDFGGRLVHAAEARNIRPTLIVNWVYGEALFEGMPEGSRRDLYETIQSDYASLSDDTGAALVNTGKVWERVHAADPTIPLYEDGNHPSLQGSYLSALILYAFLSRTDARDVTYVPPGISEHEAKAIRQCVTDFIGAGER